MKATYLLVLLGCLAAALPLEVVFATRVLRQGRRLGLTAAAVLVVFVPWDVAAVRAGHWSFDPRQVLGVRVGGLPLEELLFFCVVPLCSVLTLETARRVLARRQP